MNEKEAKEAHEKLTNAHIGLARLDEAVGMAFSTAPDDDVIHIFPVPTTLKKADVDGIVERMDKARKKVA